MFSLDVASGGQVNGCHETVVIGLERLGVLQMQTDKDGAEHEATNHDVKQLQQQQ